MRNLVVSEAVGSLLHASKWAALEERSTVVRITVFPCKAGSPVTKCSAMWDQRWLGTVRLCSWLAWGFFPGHRPGKAATNSLVSLCRVGHQNLLRRKDSPLKFRVAGEMGCVCPLEDLKMDGSRDKQFIGLLLSGSGSWAWVAWCQITAARRVCPQCRRGVKWFQDPD